MTDVNGTLFFNAFFKLWKSDGTVAGTVPVVETQLRPDALYNFNGTLVFNSGGQLYKSDGTAAGTTVIAPTLSMNPRNFTAVGSRLYFRGSDSGGDELWTTNLTDAGTYRVKDINPGSATSDPRQLTNVNGKLFFRAHGSASDDELWTSDGTDAGTVRVKDINSGASSSEPVSF